MKKVIALSCTALLALTLTACGSGSAGFDFPEPYTLHVPVHELEEETVFSSTYAYSDYVYDDAGNITEKKVSGSQRGTYTYTYDDQGRVLTETYVSAAYPDSYDTYTYTYNDHDQIETSIESSDGIRDGNEFHYTYEYDTQDRVTKETCVNVTGDNFTTVSTYEYGADGLVVRETETSYPDGLDNGPRNSYQMENHYNAWGRLVQTTVTKTGESGSNQRLYTYAQTGTEEVASDSEEALNPVEMWTGFEQNKSLPAPDSCLNQIQLKSAQNGQYTYFLPENTTEAARMVRLYQAILTDLCTLTATEDSDGVLRFTDAEGNDQLTVSLVALDDSGARSLQIQIS